MGDHPLGGDLTETEKAGGNAARLGLFMDIQVVASHTYLVHYGHRETK